MPTDPERKARIEKLEAELESTESEYDRVENMGSMSDREHALARQISWLSSQIENLKKLESEPEA